MSRRRPDPANGDSTGDRPTGPPTERTAAEGSPDETESSITPRTAVTVPDHVLFRKLDGEAILLNTETGFYFGLDAVGTAIWAGLREHRTIEAVLPRLLEVFEVDADTLERDLVEFVDELLRNDLLEARD